MPARTNPAALDDGSGQLSRRALGTLLVLCGALFLEASDVSSTGVALPSIDAELGMSTSALQWVVSAYVVGYGGFMLLGGRAADLLGRRRMFLISLGVFVVASGLGALANDGNLLIATRFIKGIAAGFTLPAGLSIITTNFAEGQARNKALSAYAATGGTGFVLGLVLSGLLTEIGWRWVFAFPVPVALLLLLAATRLVPNDGRPDRGGSRFDLAGAIGVTAGMLALVFTLVEAPEQGWASVRTLGGLAVAAAILAGFVVHEQRTTEPLVRLGILRSGSLVRANIGAMALVGAWFGFQFALTLYLQQLRGWSALETGLAILPAGLPVAVLSPRIAPLLGRFGAMRLAGVGLALTAIGYALVLPIEADSGYLTAMLVPFAIVGVGFALALGPLNVAATNGIAPSEQGLAGGLVNTSIQLGGALVLAISTAVNEANAGEAATASSFMDGFHAAVAVSVIAAALGAGTLVLRSRRAARLAGEVAESVPEPAEAGEVA